MNKSHAVLQNAQHGATLVLALLILVMIMMYGIPAAMNSIQNERMTGNTRQRDLAFQATEHAIRKADDWIKTQTSTTLAQLAPDTTSTRTNASGTCVFYGVQDPDNSINYWQTYNWTSNSCTFTGSEQVDSSLVAAQPRYIVERMPDATESGVPKSYYRITARGVGKDSNAIVILQTMYKFD